MSRFLQGIAMAVWGLFRGVPDSLSALAVASLFREAVQRIGLREFTVQQLQIMLHACAKLEVQRRRD